MSLAGFEPAIPASDWPQTHALDRAATVIVTEVPYPYKLIHNPYVMILDRLGFE